MTAGAVDAGVTATGAAGAGMGSQIPFLHF